MRHLRAAPQNQHQGGACQHVIQKIRQGEMRYNQRARGNKAAGSVELLPPVRHNQDSKQDRPYEEPNRQSDDKIQTNVLRKTDKSKRPERKYHVTAKFVRREIELIQAETPGLIQAPVNRVATDGKRGHRCVGDEDIESDALRHGVE